MPRRPSHNFRPGGGFGFDRGTYGDGVTVLRLTIDAKGNIVSLASVPIEFPGDFTVAASDESTALTAGTGKLTFRANHDMTLTEVRASLTTAQATNGGGGIFTVDINVNGSSILSTKLTIDNTEKTSVTAATPAVISSASIADDDEITIDIDQIGDGTAKGLKISFIGTRQ